MISNLGFCQVVLLHSFPKILNAAVWSWQSSCVYPFMPEKAKKWPQLPRLTASYTELSSGPDKALRQRKTTMCFEKSTEYRSCFFLLKQIISKKWDFSLINMLLIMLMNSFKYILFLKALSCCHYCLKPMHVTVCVWFAVGKWPARMLQYLPGAGCM